MNWCFWTVVLEKTLESPLDCKEIQPDHPKGDQSWIFIGRTDAEAEAPILWPPDAKNWLIWKDPDAGKDWRQEEKGTTEDEMAGWHHWLNGHEFEQTPGVGHGHRGLACCSPWVCKELDMTDWLNWTNRSLPGQAHSLEGLAHLRHATLCLQSNKAILFYFTHNSWLQDSIQHQCTEARFGNSLTREWQCTQVTTH